MLVRRLRPALLALSALALLPLVGLRAQDPLFSQFTASPTQGNPGMVGLFDGELRLSAHVRDQWASVLGTDPLRTLAAGGELRVNVGGRDYLAASIQALSDQGGQAGFTQQRASCGVTLQKYLGGGRGRDATYLGVGGRVGFGQNGVSDDGLWYTSNLDTGTLVISPGGDGLPVGFTGRGRSFLDVGAGVNLAVVRERYSVVAGLGALHLNRPDASLLFTADYRLPVRYTAVVAGEYLVRDELRLMPALNVERQGESLRAMAGGGLYYDPTGDGDVGLRVGTYARLASQLERGLGLEALVFAGQVEFRRTTFGLSYDVNTGAIGRTVDARGAFELSLSWTRPGRSRYKVVCPKF